MIFKIEIIFNGVRFKNGFAQIEMLIEGVQTLYFLDLHFIAHTLNSTMSLDGGGWNEVTNVINNV